MSCALYARLLNDSTDTTPTDGKGLLQILLPPSLVTSTVGSFLPAHFLGAYRWGWFLEEAGVSR